MIFLVIHFNIDEWILFTKISTVLLSCTPGTTILDDDYNYDNFCNNTSISGTYTDIDNAILSAHFLGGNNKYDLFCVCVILIVSFFQRFKSLKQFFF